MKEKHALLMHYRRVIDKTLCYIASENINFRLKEIGKIFLSTNIQNSTNTNWQRRQFVACLKYVLSI